MGEVKDDKTDIDSNRPALLVDDDGVRMPPGAPGALKHHDVMLSAEP